VRALACAGLFGIVAAACGSDDSGSSRDEGGREPAAEVAPGGSLVFAFDLSPTGLDPVSSSGASNGNGTGVYNAAVFDMLVYVEDETFEVKMGTAESLTSEDGKVWTLQLRDGIEFSDGTPYDAAAVKYTWEKIAHPDSASPNAGVARQIESMEVVDPLTLEITLKAPNAHFDRNVANQIPFIGSPTAWEAAGDAAFAEKPVGAGPFVVDSWVRDSTVKMSRNENYWVEGKPLLDSLEIRFLDDGTQRYNSFQTGEVQLAYLHSDVRMIPQAEQAGFQVVRPTVPGGLTLMFNTARPPFDDPIARQAVAYAIDRAGLDDVVNAGANPMPENIYEASHPFHDEDTLLAVTDKEKAQELLDEYEAKYGKPLTFTIGTADSQQANAEYLQAQFAGDFDNLKLEIEIMPGLQVVENALAGNFEATFFTMNWSDPEPDISNFLASGGGRNYMKYVNPEMDEVISTGRDSFDVEERAKAYRRAQQILAEDVPLTFVSPLSFIHLVGDDVRNFSMYNSGIPRWAEIGLAAD
jgi:peptide/nickel transport system substrate-binding protein